MRAARSFGFSGLLGLLGLVGLSAPPGCGHTTEPDAAAPLGLRSQRRLIYVIARPVPVATTPAAAGVAAALDPELRAAVRRDMTELGLEVERDPKNGYDLMVSLSASVQPVGRLTRAKAVLGIMADGRMLESINSAEIIQPPGERLAGALARDLVENLARSARAAEYANSLYGQRLRPLRDTVGSHAYGRSDPGAGLPPVEMLMIGQRRRDSDRTRIGRPELQPPASAPAAQAAAQVELAKGQSLLTAGRYKDAYSAFEQGYIIDRDVEPLFGMAEALMASGDRHDALIFYRVYLQTAPPNTPSTTKAQARLSTLETQTP